MFANDYFYGVDTLTKTSQGYLRRAFLNNAATPLILKPVVDELYRMLPYYSYGNEKISSSEILHEAYNVVREESLMFVGGDPQYDTVIYTQNTTAAINILSHVIYQQMPEKIVLTTRLEHMANYLPFREKQRTVLVELTADGQVDMADYHQKLAAYQGEIALVAVSGAANVTGIMPPVHAMAELAHQYGVMILVDAVQLVQHQPFQMYPHHDPRHIDFLTFDGHKCYSGQSGGLLIGHRSVLDRSNPQLYGSGITDFVSENRIIYKNAPERFETGYPDFLGIISLGAALRFFRQIGMPEIVRYESELYHSLVYQLKQIPGLSIFTAPAGSTCVPIVAFTLQNASFSALSRRLGYEYGIALAAGTIGANLYVQDLLGLTEDEAYQRYVSGGGYGVVRASIGLCNSCEDINRLAQALYCIAVNAV